MIDGFRITILTCIFPNLGVRFSRIVLIFSKFSCCWSSRGTFSRVRIHQARNGRFHCIIFEIVQGSAFLARKVGRNSNFQIFRGVRIVWTFRYFFLLNRETATKQGHFAKKLKPECGASSQRCNDNKRNRGTVVFFCCCWFPISVYKHHVLPLAVTIQWTATEHPQRSQWVYHVFV